MRKVNVNTDVKKIEKLLTRGVENIYPSYEFLEKRLKSGEQLSLYLGIDPTGPTLHLGHAIVLKKLKEFQELGHKIVLLVGDFTGMVGDPTDKTATRKKLTKAEVFKNAKLYKQQASSFLNFKGRNSATVKYNSAWLSKMNFENVLNLAAHMTVEQMLKRDMFEERSKEGKPIYIHEFLYPLLQGYDSVAMKVDGEIGGNDQTFNMLTGRTLMKQILNKEKFVVTIKLLEDPTGKKMGKTEGNMITLKDDRNEMFGKVMSWTDGMIIPGFILCTDVPTEEIEKIKKDLENDVNPRDIKVQLAREIVEFYHGEEASKKAREEFTQTFTKGGIPEDTRTVTVDVSTLLVEVLLKEGVVSSKNEFRRLIVEGAITTMATGEKISNEEVQIAKDDDFKIGKRRFIKIRVKK